MSVSQSEKRRSLQFLLVILGVAALLYMPTLTYPFLPFDDDTLVIENPISHGLTGTNIHAAFTSFDPELYIPLTFLSYQVNFSLAGLSPWMFHLTNLLLHLVNASLVFAILRKFLKNDTLILIVTAVFALHPISVETVTWIAARKDLLSATFALCTLLLHVRYKEEHERLWYTLSLFCFLLALLSKVSIALLPLGMLVIDAARFGNTRKSAVEMIPFLALSGAFCTVAFAGKVEGYSALNLWQMILLGTQNITVTLSHFVWPANLSILYPWTATPVSIAVPHFAAGLLGAAAVTGLALTAWKKDPLASAGIALFLFLLAPSTFNLYKFDSIYTTSDRYGYCAMLGVLLAAGIFAERMLRAGAHAWRKNTARTCAGALLFALLFLSWRQLSLWSNDLRFFSSTIARYPDSYVAHNNLGNAYARSGFGTGALIRALAEFEEANRLKPGIPRIQMNIASTEALLGRHADAEKLFLAETAAQPGNAEAWFRLGNFYASRKEKEKALDAYKKSMAIDPSLVTEAFEKTMK